MKLSEQWNLYKKSFSVQLSSWMAYRLNFFLFLLAIIIFNLFGPIVVYLIYSNNLTFPGWSFYQVLLLLGTLSFVGGLEHYSTSAIAWWSSELIRRGKFDQMMIHPISPLKLLAFRMPDIDGLAQVATGLVIIAYSVSHLDVAFGASAFLMYALAIIIGYVLLVSFDIMAASANFLFVKAHAISDFFHEMRMFARYPITIFGSAGYFLFTFIIPVGLASFYPAQAFLGRISWWIIARSAVVALVFLMFSLFLWQIAIRKYTSAGG